MKEWIVVASCTQARIFSRERKEDRLHWVTTLVDPISRRRPSSRYSERTGPHLLHFVGDYDAHPVDSPACHADANTGQFARGVIRYLKNSYQEKKFTRLTVFAEPRLLCRLKFFSREILPNKAVRWISKDLEFAKVHQTINDMA